MASSADLIENSEHGPWFPNVLMSQTEPDRHRGSEMPVTSGWNAIFGTLWKLTVRPTTAPTTVICLRVSMHQSAKNIAVTVVPA